MSKQVNTSLQNIDFEGMYSKLEPKLNYINIKGDHEETQKSKKVSNKSSHFQIEVDTNQNTMARQSIPDASSKGNSPLASKRVGHRNSLSYKESMNTQRRASSQASEEVINAFKDASGRGDHETNE